MIDPPVAALAGYAIGSIPTGLWIAKAARTADPRGLGSGSTGATNVARAAGLRAGIAAFTLDAVKGAIAAWGFGPVAAVAAVAGNVASPWLRFGGGKGVATAGGALAVLAPAPTALAVLVFAAVAAAFRLMSIASIAAAISFPAWAMLLRSPRPAVACGIVSALLILLRHRDNLARWRAGTEPRLGQSPGGPKS